MNHLTNIFKINGKSIQIGIQFCFILYKLNIIIKCLYFIINNRVYCDYFHSSERKFKSPEDKLLHFMEKIFSPDWEWREQYPASNFENISMDEFNRRMLYFCYQINFNPQIINLNTVPNR